MPVHPIKTSDNVVEIGRCDQEEMTPREIKFKVWDEDKEVMHQPDEICRIHFDNGVPYVVLSWNDETLFHFILLEFTNVYDRQQKEIYEEDIIGFEGKNWEVNFESGHYYLSWAGIAKLNTKFLEIAFSNRYKIVGNARENPELLEEHGE